VEHTPHGPQLKALARAIDACERCPLFADATQGVPGAGQRGAKVMLVGEQPGDEEDLKGEPFVGPAGRLLDALLAEAGVDRSKVYVTNAVKHFKWTPRGKRRIHKTPAQAEVAACLEWLEQEIALVRPEVIVALGGTALRALTGSRASIAAMRGQPLRHPQGARIVASYHPSALLRAEGARVDELRSALLEDLRDCAPLTR
jgi:DNA polymerase